MCKLSPAVIWKYDIVAHLVSSSEIGNEGARHITGRHLFISDFGTYDRFHLHNVRLPMATVL